MARLHQPSRASLIMRRATFQPAAVERTDRVLVRSLYRHALRSPDAPALLLETNTGSIIGWRRLAHWVWKLSEQLTAAGVRPGQRVAVAMGNRIETPVIALAIQQVGAIEAALGDALPADVTRQRARSVGAVWWIESAADEQAVWLEPLAQERRPEEAAGPAWRDAQAGRAIRLIGCPQTSASTRQIEAADQAAASIDPLSTALLLWTSGTQAAPRAAMLSHHALVSNAAAKWDAVPQTADDRRLTVLPLAHAYARTCDFGTWLLSGGTLAIGHGWRGLQTLAPTLQPTVLNLVPRLALRLLAELEASEDPAAYRAALGLGQLRWLGCGGAPLTADEFRRFAHHRILVIHGYGLTEAGPVVCSTRPASARPGRVGPPVAGVTLRIDAQHRLWVRGPGVMQGYWGDPKATAKKWDAGWLDSGDLARQESDGQVQILGRADDTLVLPDGHKLQPTDIERRCARIAGVQHAVLGLHAGRLVLLLDLDREKLPGIVERVDLDGPKKLPGIVASVPQTWSDLPRWQHPQQIHCLPRPLSVARGELTVKGTLRRTTIWSRWSAWIDRQRG